MSGLSCSLTSGTYKKVLDEIDLLDEANALIGRNQDKTEISDEDLNFMITDVNEVVPYVVEIEEGGKQHYLTFLKNNWHTVEGGKRKKISGLTAKFEADFNCEAPISENTVRNYHAKDWK